MVKERTCSPLVLWHVALPLHVTCFTYDNKEITGDGGGASYKNNYQKYCTVLVAGWLGSAGTFFFVLVCLIFFYNKCVTYIIRGKVTVKTTSIF